MRPQTHGFSRGLFRAMLSNFQMELVRRCRPSPIRPSPSRPSPSRRRPIRRRPDPRRPKLSAPRLALPIRSRQPRTPNLCRQHLQHQRIQIRRRLHHRLKIAAIHKSNLGVFLRHCRQAVRLIPQNRRQSKQRPGARMEAHYRLAQRRRHHQRCLSTLHKINANRRVSLVEQDSPFAALKLARPLPQRRNQSWVG